MGEFNRGARQIAEAVGGIENIEAATHCVTRLRFALIDETKVNQKMLDAIDIVKGSFAVNGQFQVVIGQGTVNKVYAELVKETGMGEASKDDVKKARRKNESFTACCENACGHLYSDLAGDRHGRAFNGSEQHLNGGRHFLQRQIDCPSVSAMGGSRQYD